MTAHIYPKADATTQWFGKAYEGDTMPHPNVIVLHTTEGSSFPSYGGGGSAPTFTVKGGTVRQHFYANHSARALVNASGGVETNTLNVVQIELVGTCAKGGPGLYWPDAKDADMAALVDLIDWLTDTYPIPLVSTSKPWLSYPSSYGSKNGQRMSFAEWNNFNGICGHQHVPENQHGDPGNFPIKRLIELVKAKKAGSKPAAPKPAPKPAAKPVVDLSNVIAAARRDPGLKQGGTTHPADVKIVEKALKAEGLLSSTYASDGSFGSATIVAYRKWQLKLYPGASTQPGGAADGIPGMDSLKRLGAKHGFTVKA